MTYLRGNERLTVAISRRASRAIAALTTALALSIPATLAPAASANPLVDNLGRPSPEVLAQLEKISPQLPEELGGTLDRLISFIRGDGEPGVDIPQNGPAFTQFGWPTIAGNCIGGESNAVGLASAVPGPAPLPLPGVKAGQVNFVFTALGTGTVAKQQNTSMNVHWVNINNAKFGTTQLGYNGINPEGPATVNGAADTGNGLVLALLEGGVTTNNEDAAPSDCNFIPTAAIIPVG